MNGNILRRINQCENCAYPRVYRNFCPHCSSIGHFPTRCRLFYAMLLLFLVAGSLAVVFLPSRIARSEASKTIAETKSFAVLRTGQSATNRWPAA